MRKSESAILPATGDNSMHDGFLGILPYGHTHRVLVTTVPASEVKVKQLNDLRRRIESSGFDRKVEELELVHKEGLIYLTCAVGTHLSDAFTCARAREIKGFLRRSGIRQSLMICNLRRHATVRR